MTGRDTDHDAPRSMMSKPRLSLRSVLAFVGATSLLFAWWADHSRLKRLLNAERERNFLSGMSWQERRANVAIAAARNPPDVAILLFALSATPILKFAVPH